MPGSCLQGNEPESLTASPDFGEIRNELLPVADDITIEGEEREARRRGARRREDLVHRIPVPGVESNEQTASEIGNLRSRTPTGERQ